MSSVYSALMTINPNALIPWLIYWYAIWGIFNLLMLPAGFTMLKKYRASQLLFLIAFIPPAYLAYGSNLVLIAIFAQLLYLLILVMDRQHRIWEVYFSLAVDVAFQQAMLVLLFQDAAQNWLAFALLFIFAHFPIYFLKHVTTKGKIILTLVFTFGSSLLGIALAILPNPFNFLVSFSLHYGFYLIFLPLEKKYRFGLLP